MMLHISKQVNIIAMMSTKTIHFQKAEKTVYNILLLSERAKALH